MTSIRFVPFVLAVFSIGGCASNSIPHLSDTKEQQILNIYNGSSKAQTGADLVNHEAWLQAENKKEECKLLFRDTTPPGAKAFWETGPTKVFWDGDCKGGYAHGLGREFFEGVSTGLMSDVAFYGEPGSEPTYYYKAGYDYHRYSYVHSEKESDGSETRYFESVQVRNLNQNTFQFVEIASVQNKSRDLMVLLEYLPFELRGELARHYGHGGSVFFNYSQNPSDQMSSAFGLSANGEYIARAVTFKNGVTTHEVFENNVPKMVSFGEDLRKLMAERVEESKLHIRQVQDRVAPSKRVVEMYKRGICQGEVSVDWMDDGIYGRICLPEGDLAPYASDIKAYSNDQARLQKKAQERMDKMLEQQREQQIAAQQRAQQNQRELAATMSQFNASMAAFNQNASRFRESVISQPTPSVNFGNTGSSSTNCVVVSNIINCKTR